MARFDMQSYEDAGLAQGAATGDILFRLGMMYATGRTVEPDLITAHKWFNIAATKGYPGAARYRQEVAAEMSSADVAEAQRAAREWLNLH
ncbi:SEL1-like repeat protein [Microbaculum sp. FT89]|uniref:SEL1-like repeat protein n=1 Tax=Microbaculum sp. FT89 TaxID=3447298 RepID=UPI003F5297B6